MGNLRIIFSFMVTTALLAVPCEAEGDRRGPSHPIYYGSAEDIAARRANISASSIDATESVDYSLWTSDVPERDDGSALTEMQAPAANPENETADFPEATVSL
jgi:hypothetical protein